MTDRTTDLIDRVRAAHADGSPLKITGGDSKALLGRTINAQALPVLGHDGVVNYDPGELVITVRAGTPLSELEKILAEKGQMLTFEPPHISQESTIGGTLATNLSGPARPWGGSGRDMVLGMRLLSGDGELVNFGGQVMKNVAGYDVSRFQCGGFGCFGIISEVSLKVLPARPSTIGLMAQVGDPDAAILYMNKICTKNIPITGAAWLDKTLHIRLAGGRDSLLDGLASTRRFLPELRMEEEDMSFWDALRHFRCVFFQTEEPIWRFSVRSTADHFLPGGDWLIDWAGAQRWLKGTYDRADLENRARAAGGTVSLFRNGDQSADPFQAPDDVIQRMQLALKSTFDPKRIFNPGRLYSWL